MSSDCLGCKGRPIKFTEAANAAKGMVSILRPVERATGELIEYRAKICRDCPSKVRKHNMDFCGKPFHKTDTTCGCVVWAKIRVIKEDCPQGKW